MPESTLTPDFEHEVLEADIKRLAEEIQKNRERPESRDLGGKEVLKQALGSLAPPSPASPPTPPAAGPLPDYAAGQPAEVRLEIEYLLDVAFHKGIEKAEAEARRSPPFVLDAFRDALAGKLYPELQRRGILK